MTSFVQIAHLTSIDCFRTIKYDSSLYAKQQQLSKWRPSPMFANNFMLFAQRISLTPTLNCCAFSQPRRAVWIAGSLPSWHATCPTYGIHIAAYFGNWAWEIPMCRLACLAPSLSLSFSLSQLPMSNANLTVERMQQRGNFKGKCATRGRQDKASNENPSACQILKKYSQVYYAHKYIYIWLCI